MPFKGALGGVGLSPRGGYVSRCTFGAWPPGQLPLKAPTRDVICDQLSERREVAWVRDSLAEPDHGAVVGRQPGSNRDFTDRVFAQSGHDSVAKVVGIVGPIRGRLPNREFALVRRVLCTSSCGGVASVGGVAAFVAEAL